ncbi:regulator [Acetobacter malorum]|uniref:Regulator n=1 Tax=Acetobacter malorum TaxID=178901 RepID=A0A149VG35_9PROT|nr:response regulator transcription factor [Acetobacter malorum]KXV79140.1 regulator [Acetobacter malorum]
MRILCIGSNSANALGLPCPPLTQAATDGAAAITLSAPEGIVETLRRSQYDLVVIQAPSPETRLIRHIRNSRLSTPILVIVTTTTPALTAEALALGADDCVLTTMDPIELLARLRAVVRRAGGHDSQTLHIGRLSVDVATRQICVDGKLVPLTPKEYDLVELLSLRKNQFLNKEAVLDSLYSGGDEPHGKVIDVMICKIRKKMRTFDISEPFLTLWRTGYRLNESAFTLTAAIMNTNQAPPHASRESSIPIRSGINIISP